MDFDINLFFNFIPFISITTITLITCTTAFYKIRNRLPVKVNCWFCNCNVKVQRQSLDWWFCPHCEQYNGFRKDGDYKYEIPEQHRIKHRSSITDKSYCQRKTFQPSQNSLCEKCNTKEEIKLNKLRELEDSVDEFDDKKLLRFESKFEKKFPLCSKCQSIVKNVLHQQRVWITQYKMLLFKQKPIKRLIMNREWIERVVRVLLSILASVAIYFTEAWYLPLSGILFQLVACIASPAGNRKFDIFPIIGWTCLVLIRAFSTTAILKVFKIYFNNDWVSDHDNTYNYFIITLSTAVGLSNLKFKSSKSITNGSLAFKKLESSSLKNTLSRSPSSKILSETDEEPNNDQDTPRNFHSPVNITDSLMALAAVETPIPLRPASFAHWVNMDKKMTSSSLSTTKPSIVIPETDSQLSRTSKISNYYLNESLNSLNSLSLGSQSKTLSNPSKVFETRVYSTASPDIFNKQHRYYPKRSILAPPKLHSLMQSSWVEDGYWHSSIDMPTLSRSSSQSSGFGSSGSNYGHSREPSIHEFDQCSVASERCYFTRPESPLPTHNSAAARLRSNTCSANCSQISDIDSTTRSCNGTNNSKCSAHTAVVTSPMFSILLCGSLVLNIVVLCTILLR
ncbi:transmembrane protein 201 homolog [Phymastichus coffea]|uniref:transmembrane protein 201 homolog n=1 Tax=Phymastichus coffea TaxID=108790 RepID=UPI00273CB041|nr:transmembrane protein 201 homolog [Phymastichus coffea]XP_058807608.1 transmembrane protein 201 homolog [Phymastichus coffea]